MISKLLLSLITLGYSLVPVLADFNKTHATNPLWTGHARYHVVWQVTSYVLLAAVALFLVWTPGPMEDERFLIAAAIAASIYIGFFSALASMRAYGGELADKNGVPPARIAGRMVDLNVLIFSIIAALLVLCVVAVSR